MDPMKTIVLRIVSGKGQIHHILTVSLQIVQTVLTLSPGPLRGGERAWYTLYVHAQSLRKFF